MKSFTKLEIVVNEEQNPVIKAARRNFPTDSSNAEKGTLFCG